MCSDCQLAYHAHVHSCQHYHTLKDIIMALRWKGYDLLLLLLTLTLQPVVVPDHHQLVVPDYHQSVVSPDSDQTCFFRSPSSIGIIPFWEQTVNLQDDIHLLVIFFPQLLDDFVRYFVRNTNSQLVKPSIHLKIEAH